MILTTDIIWGKTSRAYDLVPDSYKIIWLYNTDFYSFREVEIRERAYLTTGKYFLLIV